MSYFPDFKTKRIDVSLRSLNLNEAITLAEYPVSFYEKTLSTFLEMVCTANNDNADVRAWSAQERIGILSHYISSTSDSPDFPVGLDGAKFSDYLKTRSSAENSLIEMGEIFGDKWKVRELTGYMTEALEASLTIQSVKPRAAWVIGSMAMQMVTDDDLKAEKDKLPSDVFTADYVIDRLSIFVSFSQDQFSILRNHYLVSSHEFNTMFNIAFSKEGVIVMPEIGGDADIAPAVFRVSDAISDLAKSLSE